MEEVGLKYRRKGMRICKRTRRLGQVGFGMRRQKSDAPIPGTIKGSFMCHGGNGYFMERADNGKLIQVQAFMTPGELVEWFKRISN